MKKALSLLLIMAMLLLAACGGNQAPASQPSAEAPAEAPAEAAPVQHDFDLSEGEELYIEDQVFSETVTISGDNASITFAGCQFPQDVVLTSPIGTRVMLLDCTVSGSCVFDSGVKEGTMETSLPKFLTSSTVDVIHKDSYGAVITLGDFEITCNGESYSIADSELFFDSNDDAGFVPYTGQEANIFYLGQWWENDQLVPFVYCEYDPGM